MADATSYQRQCMISALRASGIADQRLLELMGRLPRHLFVPEGYRNQAYDPEVSINIGEGQTISQPRVVARMTEAAALDPGDKVLEVGTGSGYQTAVLAGLARFVFSVERIAALARTADRRLADLGIENVSIKVMDGSLGWRAQGPFAAILVTAAAPTVPAALCEQLVDGGRLVVPVGDRDHQILTLVVKRGARLVVDRLEDACFVPLIGRQGFTT